MNSGLLQLPSTNWSLSSWEGAGVSVRSTTMGFTPSPGMPEGRGEGCLTNCAEDPHPNPLPGYRERRQKATGFTFPELLLGMIVTAMVGLSCAAVALAVSTGWKSADESNSEFITRGRTTLYVQSLFQGAKRFGVVRNGDLENPSAGTSAAAVLFWRADLNNDGKIQLKELALIQHSPADDQLLVYQASFPSAAVESSQNITVDETHLDYPSAPEGFIAQPYVSARIAARDVIGARFDAIHMGSTTQRLSLEFLLKMQLGEATDPPTYEYGTATLRPMQ